MRRLVRVILAAGVTCWVLALGAAPAGANMTGPCEASGTLTAAGFTVDAKKSDKVTVPSKDDVAWKASVPGRGRRSISGSIDVSFPPPIGKITVGEWSSESKTYSNADTYSYDLPSVVAGFDIPVTGTHHDKGFTCSGSVIVRVEGGGLKNPAALASLGFTVISAAGVSIALLVKP